MGSISIYLLPETEVDPTEYGKTVKRVLLEMGIIDDENYEYENWWVAGSRSNTIFQEPGTDIGFEYCILYSSPHVELVPQDPAVFPRCPSCAAELSDQFYELINEIEENHAERPARKARAYEDARLKCGTCGVSAALPDLKDDHGIYLHRTWVNFEDTPGSLRADWVREFSRATGWNHRAVEYWYT
jgi:hypothetical protein